MENVALIFQYLPLYKSVLLRLSFKAQLTNAFFATVNQMFAGSFQFSTTAEHS